MYAYRRDLDGIRGLAILLVLLYHFFPKVLPGGFVGVDVFFVLSGYLIAAIAAYRDQSGGFSAVNFY